MRTGRTRLGSSPGRCPRPSAPRGALVYQRVRDGRARQHSEDGAAPLPVSGPRHGARPTQTATPEGRRRQLGWRLPDGGLLS